MRRGAARRGTFAIWESGWPLKSQPKVAAGSTRSLLHVPRSYKLLKSERVRQNGEVGVAVAEGEEEWQRELCVK